VFRQTGIAENLVEDFFVELRDGVNDAVIAIDRPDESRVLIRAVS
jgi:hypothetical protein